MSTVTPAIGIVALSLTWGNKALATAVIIIVGVILIASVLAAVHHAEVVAARVGEPFGSIVLAVSVTIIEVALIVTMMLSGGAGTESLARDTVFSAIMITVNGIVGVSLFLGARRSGLAVFNSEGSGAALATVTVLAGLTLVLPSFTTSSPGPFFSPLQLGFAGVASLAVYAMFIVTQTYRHRDFFVPVAVPAAEKSESEPAGPRPSGAVTLLSLALLLVSLIAVVGLAKVESPSIESAIAYVGFPPAFLGVVIAFLVLLPESIAAFRYANRDQIQTSLNLGFGSAIASIGLTVPVMAVASLWLPQRLELGLGPTQLVLLALSLTVGVLTVVPGRATRMHGGMHAILFFAFVFVSISP